MEIETVEAENHVEGLTEETRYHQRVSLYKAAFKGEWGVAEDLLERDIIRSSITDTKETALHIAALQGHEDFVAKLLDKMEPTDLQILNAEESTALCFAAAAGHLDIANLMVNKNKTLPIIRGENGASPLYMAALQGFNGMAKYLYPLSEFQYWTPQRQIELVTTLIDSELYGLAMEILVEEDKTLAVAKDSNGHTPLHVLARKPLAFSCSTRPGGLWLYICKTILPYTYRTNTMNEASDASKLLDHLWKCVTSQNDIEIETPIIPGELPFVAAESENEDFVVELIRRHPELAYKRNEKNHSIFHIAVKCRYLKVFNLMYELGGVTDLIATYIDEDGNNMLHLAAKLAPQNQLNAIPGAALQMQREVLWYKEVEKIVRLSYRSKKNNAGETPYYLFLLEHGNLIKEGDKLVKEIAKNCMLMTILIATVMFSAAFSVPNTTSAGAPDYKEIFVVFEAVAILSSLTSTLVFLSMLTSRCSDDHFLKSLPIWLITGMVTLFISIVAMMMAFCTSPVFFHRGWAIKTILLVLFASVPVLFVILKYPLFATLLRSTYSCTTLFRSNNLL